jgi:hypothetical protein
MKGDARKQYTHTHTILSCAERAMFPYVYKASCNIVQIFLSTVSLGLCVCVHVCVHCVHVRCKGYVWVGERESM